MDKSCIKCRETKDISNFYLESRKHKNGNVYSYYRGECRQCKSRRIQLSRVGKKRKTSPKKSRQEWLKSKYGLSEQDYANLFVQQKGLCATCKIDLGETTKNIHIDHNHSCCPGQKSCGKCVRGLLCPGCNLALGLIKDNKDTLVNMKNYLDYWSNNE